MDDADAKKLVKIAKSHARKKRYYNLADDFSQYVIVKNLEGKSKPIGFFFVDFLRELHGRTGDKATAGERLRSSANREYVQLKPEDGVSMRETNLTPDFMIKKLVKGMIRNPFDKSIINLSLFWEFTAEEIAEVYGVTRYVIDKSLARSLDKLRQFLDIKF